MQQVTCPKCNGTRLRKESLFFKIDGRNIAELSALDILQLEDWFHELENRLTDKQRKIAQEVLKEIRKRIRFLLDQYQPGIVQSQYQRYDPGL